MIIFIIFDILLIGILFFLIFAFSMFWPPDSPWAPWWRTDKDTAEAICKFAKIKKDDIIYDLGCGDAEVLLTAAKKYGTKGVGVEIDLIRFFTAKIRVLNNRLGKVVKIKRGNFFKTDLSEATIINVYLVPKTLEKLKMKFLKELNPGTRIISYKYEMSLGKIAENKKRKLFLYKV